MATMVKEKRREKKKSKEKSRRNDTLDQETRTNLPESIAIDDNISATLSVERDFNNMRDQIENSIENTVILSTHNTTVEEISPNQYLTECETPSQPFSSCSDENIINDTYSASRSKGIKCNPVGGLSTTSYLAVANDQTGIKPVISVTDNYEYLNKTLERIAIPELTESFTEVRELELSNPEAYLKPSEATEYLPYGHDIESAIPSAPMFEDETQPPMKQCEEQIHEVKPKQRCMPMEEALKIFGGKEMAAVKTMSEKEEAIVEAGPTSGPEHPLVDLLSTFKSSLRALETERSRLTCALADEEKFRSTLWKVEKRHIHQKKQCQCGSSVELRASYEHAQLLKERMPAARLKLDSLLTDIQDSYCHHQHAVLLAHCQIEELISETVESNTPAIREALSLIMRALRLCDGSVPALPAALQRWAAALVAALPLADDSQLLFVLHNLSRQSRSVVWAARVLRPRIPDAVAAARALAIIDMLLASPRLDGALECTEEDADEDWEEVSARGAGGVRAGAWREMDLLALLRAFPLRDLLARILHFTHADIRGARGYEWGDVRGGRDVVAACCAVRALVATAQRAAHAHRNYRRLTAELRRIVAAALEGLSCLYRSPRSPYADTVREQLGVELQACFVAAFDMFGTQQLHRLDTALLADHTAKDYCLTFIIGLHDTTPREIDSLSISAPVLPCAERVRIVTCAARRRRADHELARIVLDYLLQTGGKADACGGACGAAARAHLARLLTAHPYLRTAALLALANLAQVTTVEPLLVGSLEVHKWRPSSEEMEAVLQEWGRRCPQLLHLLLLHLDCTPFTGLSLPVQLSVGSWLCARVRSQPADSEVCWRALVRLRTHRACWRLPPDAPAPHPPPTDLFSTAFALLSASWGDSIPLICSHGVDALCALSARTRIQVHCLAPVMLRMAHSPDSVSLTPRFGEVFTSVLRSGPSLVQRALGRAAVCGEDLLLRLALTQIEDELKESSPRVSVFPAWVHALWRLPLRGAAAVLDTVAATARHWPALDAHADLLLQEENAKDIVCNAVRNASCAPLLCECLLRAAHRRELSTQMFGALANMLWEQRVNGQKVHVDNALQKIKAGISSEELVIYRCASAALVAPLQHPSHLSLWRLFFHLYLQRPPTNMRDAARPVGPLFFSGLVNSRTLAQLTKRLQETAEYHKNEAETYKTTQTSQSPNNRVNKSASITIEKGLLPELSIKDMTGESSGSDCDSDLSEESEEDSDVGEKGTVVSNEADKKHAFNMACYHTAAERLVREMCGWVGAGEAVCAAPHHADLARYLPDQALEAAWRDTVSRGRPAPCDELDQFPRPATPPAPPARPTLQHKTPLDEAVATIMRIKDKSGPRSARVIKCPLEDVDVNNHNQLFEALDRCINSIEEFGTEWGGQVSRISSLDRALWELVGALRVPRPLPPAAVPCPAAHAHKCTPLLFYIEEREWCISTGAERAIQENRASWARAVRAACRARPAAARTVAALLSLARRVRDKSSAVCAAERIWRAAGAQGAHCGATRGALQAALQILAERWLVRDGECVVSLVSRWGSRRGSPLQQTLCGALVAPRLLPTHAWPALYDTLLRAHLPPHARFSYLSKFDMRAWSASSDAAARRALLAALLRAQTETDSSPEHAVLLELLGVHTAALLTPDDMCAVVMQFVSLSVEGRLPPRQWPHLLHAVDTTADTVPFDQLSRLTGELGAAWWRAREARAAGALAPLAAHVAALHARLLRALLTAAQNLTYSPERVGTVAWTAFCECWGAWIAPHPCTPALLPSSAEGGGYSLMLQRALDALKETIASCPGCETVMLQSVFEWTCAWHATCRGGAHVSELLAALADLPWDRHQWFTGNCLTLATQVCASNDVEMTSWCCARWQATTGATLLRDVTHDTLPSRLITLLYLFTGNPLPHARHMLEEAASVPWRALPTAALPDALDRFFMTHHDPSRPYHDFPQFQVLVHASMLRVGSPEGGAGAADARARRALAVTAWSRAAAAPALLAHCAAAARCILDTLTDLAAQVEQSSGELEDLLGRASVLLCLEPAAALVLPVWLKWVEGTTAVMMRACVTVACALTAPAYSAQLADAAVRACLHSDACGWQEVVSRWHAASPWRDPLQLISRSCLYAAYACARAFQPLQCCGPSLHALQLASPNLHFVSNEAIIAVWICYACRAALADTRDESGGSTNESACHVTGGSTNQSALSLLQAWAQPARRSLLQVVTLQTDDSRPTARHRVLSRMALCIVAPSGEARAAYEAACAGAGVHGDVSTWARAPRPAPRLLAQLASALYPACARHFVSDPPHADPAPAATSGDTACAQH